ncbi:hypothetical protein CDAR_608071 [Caerostris darwini]|uniref:Uncharacterized protein n=1 Tax=Caerostris darwini TaxID=1538125 RepID=A0AAV4Q2Y2_9ARAC|nr:hypothetical protein CDAR_608071 [Caerostris darwini]
MVWEPVVAALDSISTNQIAPNFLPHPDKVTESQLMEHAFASYRALSLHRVVTAVHANCQNTRLAVRRCHYQHLFTGGGGGFCEGLSWSCSPSSHHSNQTPSRRDAWVS